MDGKATKYLATECIGSAVVNGLLNLGAGELLFHGRQLIPVEGPPGLLRDTIGETFLVTGLSYMAASLISRHRRRKGKLPQTGTLSTRGNIYLRSLIVALIFTAIFVPLNTLLLPKFYVGGLSFQQVIWFKAIYGALLGAIASYLAISRAFREAASPPQRSMPEAAL